MPHSVAKIKKKKKRRSNVKKKKEGKEKVRKTGGKYRNRETLLDRIAMKYSTFVEIRVSVP